MADEGREGKRTREFSGSVAAKETDVSVLAASLAYAEDVDSPAVGSEVIPLGMEKYDLFSSSDRFSLSLTDPSSASSVIISSLIFLSASSLSISCASISSSSIAASFFLSATSLSLFSFAVFIALISASTVRALPASACFFRKSVGSPE